MLHGAQGGILFSNAVTTVSPTYARESLEGGAAGWLRATLAKPEVRAKFTVRARVEVSKAARMCSLCPQLQLHTRLSFHQHE